MSKDHVHIVVSIDPSTSVSKERESSRELQQIIPYLKTRYWGQYLWARGCFAVNTGNVSSKMIEKYIAHYFEENKDFFRIE